MILTPAERISWAARALHEELTDAQRDRAVGLLTGLFAVGQQHGISPEAWGTVTNLASACVKVVAAAG